jgi:glucuronate isomerase
MKQFLDSLEWHEKFTADPTVTPSAFNIDKALDIEKATYVDYIHKLEKAVGFDLHCIKCVKKGLNQWIQLFADHGCKAADHVLDAVPYAEATDLELTGIFKKAMAGQELTKEEIDAYKTGMLLHCARQYAKLDMSMEIHVPCPDNSSEALAKIQSSLQEQPKITLHTL